MAAPNPAAGVFGGGRSLVSVEARKIHPPNIPLGRRHGARVASRQPFHSFPRKRHLDGPPPIPVVVTINGAVDKDGIGLAGKAPIKRAEPLPARMSFETDAVEWLEFGALELRRLRKAAAGVGLFPNEKCLVGGIE